MNRKTKGNNAQREYAKYIQKDGFYTEIVRNTKFKHGDYFGIADILAHNGKYWYIIQVKSNSTEGYLKKMRNQIKNFPPDTKFLLVVRYDGNAGKSPYWKIYNFIDKKPKIVIIPKSI